MDISQRLVWYFERLTDALDATNEDIIKSIIKQRFGTSIKTVNSMRGKLK